VKDVADSRAPTPERKATKMLFLKCPFLVLEQMMFFALLVPKWQKAKNSASDLSNYS